MEKHWVFERALRSEMKANDKEVLSMIKEYGPEVIDELHGDVLPNEEFKDANIGIHHKMLSQTGMVALNVGMMPDDYDIRDFLLNELWKARGFSKDASDDEIIDWATDLENRAKDSEIEDMIREGEFKEAANYMAEYIPGISIKLVKFINTRFPALWVRFASQHTFPIHKILNNKEEIESEESNSEEQC